MKVQITKCYLVQILDDNGNELEYEYVFGNKKDADKTGKELKKELKERIENENE